MVALIAEQLEFVVKMAEMDQFVPVVQACALQVLLGISAICK